MKTKLLTTLLFSLSLMLVLFYIRATLAYAGTITVTTTADTDAADGDCSLREAIIAANSDVAYNGCSPGSGDAIIDMTALSGTITLGSHLPIITRTLQFNGPSTNTLTIDGLDTYNAIYGTGSGVNIGVDHLTVTNVISDGIYTTNNITVTNSTIVGAGCGVISADAAAVVSNSHITGAGCNGVDVDTTATITAGSTISGAVDGVFANSGHITVTNSTVVGADFGVNADGGGAFVSYSAITGTLEDGVYTNNDVVVSHSTIKAGYDGVFAYSGKAQVTSSTITASNDGVDVLNDAIVTSSTIKAGYDGVYADIGKAQVTSSTITAGEDGVDVLNDAIVTSSTIEADNDGVFAYNGNAQVTSSVITATNNGVYAYDGGNAEVMSSTITSLGDDGVDANVGYARVTNSTIYGSESGVDTDTGDIEVINSRVIGNQDGINAVGNATVISSTVTGNSLAGIQSSAKATVSYSTIIDSGGDGVNALTVNIFQSTISGNGGDGAQSSNQTNVTVNHSTIVNNTGYGINNTIGTTVVSHTIIAQNSGLITTRDVKATLSAGSSYNLIGNGDGAGVTNGVNGNLVGSTGALLDPKLGLLADNGGPSTGSGQAPKTHALLPGSPAIDAIPASSCTVSDDQRGVSRPQVDGCDIGAFESQGFTLTASGGNNQSTEVNTAFGQPLSVTLTANVITEPIGSGVVISFIGPGSGASLNPAVVTATTDGNGVASVTVTANSITGTYQVTATVRGVSSPVIFNLTNRGPADLALSKTVSPTTATPGDTITYTLTFSNAGDGTASGVVITDFIPISVTVQSVISSGDVVITRITGSQTSEVFETSEVSRGEGGVITITGVLSDPLAAGIFTNTAVITATTVDTDTTNNSAEVGLTVVVPADLTASKTNDVGGTVNLGSVFTWTVTVTNTGDGVAAFASGEAILRDNLLESGISYGAPAVQNQSGIGGSGSISCSIDGSANLTCSASGGSVTMGTSNSKFDVVFTATPSTVGAKANPRGGGVCRVDPDTNATESNETNNDCSDTVTIVSADLAISKSATPATNVTYHGQVTYTVVLSNSGAADASGALFTDTLPVEVDFDRWVVQPSGASQAADEITWSGTVTADQAITLTFVVSHVGDYGDVVVNTARYSHASSSGSDDATFTVESAPPTGGSIYLPIIQKGFVSAPDLVVDSLIATSGAVTVTIRNAGTAAVIDAFWVDVYFNPSVTPGLNQPWDTIASHGAVWGVTTSIPAGGSLVLITGGDYYFPEYSSTPPLPVGADVYALVDLINYDTTYGAVQESNEGNNLFGPVVSTASVVGGAGPAVSRGRSPSSEGLPPRQ